MRLRGQTTVETARSASAWPRSLASRPDTLSNPASRETGEQALALERVAPVLTVDPPRALDDPAALRRWTQNPFYVLELSVDAEWSEIEQRAAMLERALVERPGETHAYPTPAGARRRDRSVVHAAVEALRDPDLRLLHELWASLPPRPHAPGPTPFEEPPRWEPAMGAFGWRRR